MSSEDSQTPSSSKTKASWIDTSTLDEAKKTVNTSGWLSKKKALKETAKTTTRKSTANKGKRKLQSKTEKEADEFTECYDDFFKFKKKAKESQERTERLKTLIEESGILNADLSVRKSEVESKSEEPKVNLLDCKHLSLTDLTNYFKQWKDHLLGIKNGDVFSKRHILFHKKDSYRYDKVLILNNSFIVFNDNQISHLANLMEEEFGGETLKETQYYFKVLLPEICREIFMDVHKMTKEECMKYLDERPVN